MMQIESMKTLTILFTALILSGCDTQVDVVYESKANVRIEPKDPLQELPKLSEVPDNGVRFIHNKRVLHSYRAKVVKVKDGDTITIMNRDKSQVDIRIEGVDAPESNQPFGSRAKQAVSKAIFGKYVLVQKTGRDEKYGRDIATIEFEDMDSVIKELSSELVRAGLAWNYDRYSKSDVLPELQAEAKKDKRGLWSEKKSNRAVEIP